MSDIRSSDRIDTPRGTGEDRVIYVLAKDQAGRPEDEIDLSEALRILWAGRLLILLCTLLAGAVGLAYALLAKPWYRAEVVLVPADRDSGQGLGSQLSQLGGLASLAGITIGSANKAEPVAVLQSRGFARTFIEEQGLLTVLLAEKWDPDLKKWKGSADIEPDIRDAVEYFTKVIRKVSEDRKTGLVTLRIDWYDSKLAADWANLMVEQLNSRMRDRALADAETNIAFLRTELESTQVVSLHQSIGRLLEAELQKLMLARSSEEFSFRIVDPAQAPKKKFKPQRALIVLGSLLVGSLLGVALVLVARSRA